MKTGRRVYQFSAELFVETFGTDKEIPRCRVLQGIPPGSRIAKVWLLPHPPTILVACDRDVPDDMPAGRVYQFSAELFLETFRTSNEIPRARILQGIPKGSRVAKVWLLDHPPTILVACDREVPDDTPSGPTEAEILITRQDA